MATPKGIRDAFRAFDKDHDGKISRAEMVEYLTRGNANMTEAQAGAKFDEVDANGDGEVSCEEFVKAWSSVKEAAPVYTHIELATELFAVMDVNMSGSVDAAELRKGLGAVEGSHEMFAWMDSRGDADGVVSLAEFIPGLLTMYQSSTPAETTTRLRESIAKSRSIIAAAQLAYGT